MKVKDLVHELQKYDDDAEVAIYNRSTGGALWIPNYDPDITVSPDDDFAKEYEFSSGTVFITGK